ncbi:TfoX N-terminal domain-containing protein [Fibrobacter sp. UWH9]|uniref:TfoX/Sxy family protein n=1 Tax=Fibrobacter sp. UWH9 TaxID=1896213 RepID=UPI000914B131|nr:TfoX/Sxy family protein [Fibrobacter sp. UWH9]MDO4948171.1 TfoX/Sxy family protein [Fibrobacter sp.]SHH71127.1 TfoX N-terminal domain-containing protein [Fibrobacter sp. UWH9]
MSCSNEFIDFILDVLSDVGDVRAKKMFGDWMIYVDEKPVVLACDDMAYVKKLPEITDLMEEAECGVPYEGAREHYILEMEQQSHVRDVVQKLVEVIPTPKKKRK